MRSIAPDVTLLRANVGMIPEGKDEVNRAVNAIQTVLIVKQGRNDKIALLQNTPAAFHGRPDAVETLTRELQAVAGDQKVVSRGEGASPSAV